MCYDMTQLTMQSKSFVDILYGFWKELKITQNQTLEHDLDL